MLRHRAEALAVADEIGDRQLLAAHAHDVAVEPGLVHLPPIGLIQVLDIDAAHFDPDLRTQTADFEHGRLPRGLPRVNTRTPFGTIGDCACPTSTWRHLR